jgi:hypothetical protein
MEKEGQREREREREREKERTTTAAQGEARQTEGNIAKRDDLSATPSWSRAGTT